MSLEACLPSALRGPSTTITAIAAGLSGAGVYRVEAAGGTFVLKLSAHDEPAERWLLRLEIQRRADEAGLTPAIIHADAARRAVVTAFVGGQPFPAWYADPRTHQAALVQLGQTLRRVHALPIPPTASSPDPRGLLRDIWSGLQPGFALPGFTREAVERVLAEELPGDARATVLSHNDVNPTNLIYDGERLMLVDWHTAGPMHPFYDLATISVFLRMDERTCCALLAAHDGEAVETLPARFPATRRLVAALCGALFLNLARQQQHAGATGTETLDSTLGLGDVYQQMRTGALNVASAAGQWTFGLALLKASCAM